MADARLQIVIDALNKASGELKQLQKDLGGIEAPTKKASLSLTDLKSGLDMAMGAARTFGQAMKAAFEFAEQGAQVQQARESVQMLGIDLDALRKAAGGTVDDMTLIASAAKLLAGTTGTLNEEMAKAAPALLEVARAAVKLDPTIGSVAFVYQSLATGIKKNQPLLIDNANITLKLGTANEKLAEQLGKSVNELTDEEKSIAVLNATLESGAAMIEQMGGSVDSMTDSYSQMRAILKNVTDEMKANAAEAVTPLTERFVLFMQAADHTNANLSTLEGNLDFLKAMFTGTSKVIEIYIADMEAADAGNRAAAQGFNDVGVKASIMAESEAAAAVSAGDLAASQQAAADASAMAAASFDQAASALGELSVAQFVSAQIRALEQAKTDGVITTEQYTAAQRALLVQSGLLTEAEIQAQGAIDTMVGAMGEGAMTADEYAAAALRLKKNLDQIESKTVTIGVNWDVPPMPGLGGGGGQGSGAPSGGPEMYAAGGTSRGGRVIVGERGPEMVNLPAGAQVMNHQVTNNYNLTMHTRATTAALRQDFALMRAMG